MKSLPSPLAAALLIALPAAPPLSPGSLAAQTPPPPGLSASLARQDLDEAIRLLAPLITPASPPSDKNRRRLAGLHLKRGENRFHAARIRESVADFDAVIRLFPGAKPSLWQRGISLYYAGEFEEGKRQFETHQTVNSNDVENAVWHFLCTAAIPELGLARARKQLIPIEGDTRVPMKEVHALFAGSGPAEVVLAAAETAPAGRKENALCYAHLYLGLYYEALGETEKSLAHIKKAATDHAQPHYMGAVARVHLKLRTSETETGAKADPAPAYYTTGEKTRDGIGKYYLGREIAQVVGHAAIAWLERPERERHELPAIVVQNMDLDKTDVVADIGAGSGYFTFRIAPAVPAGKVYAVDINERMLDFIREHKQKHDLTQVEPHLGTIDDTRLPDETVDLAFMVDAYHEFSHPREMMQSIVRALKPGGRVVLIEYRKEDPTVPIKPLHKMTQKQAVKEMAAVGLNHLETRDFLPRQHFMIFQKSPQSAVHSRQ